MERFLSAVGANAEKAGVFAEVKIDGARLQCAAPASAEPAWYRLERMDEEGSAREAKGGGAGAGSEAGDGGGGGAGWNVLLVTPNRWLSESIEADLMHHGDPIEELIEEELIEQGYEGAPLEVKHYRSDDMLYTFRSPIPIDGGDEKRAIAVATQCLLAYEAAFRELGDMSGSENA